MIAIITNHRDVHADYVCDKLRSRGIDYIRLNTEELVQNMEVTVEFNVMVPSSMCIRHLEDQYSFDIEEIAAFWYRRPKPVVIHDEVKEHLSKQFIQEETNAVATGLWLVRNNAYWVNDPFSIQKASNKIFQLHLAQSIGLEIPKTIITTSPSKAEEFYRQCNKKVITKVLTQGTFEKNGKASVILTNLITDDDVEDIEAVKYCPTFFQEFVPKKTELRITIVGKTIFTCEIFSQESETTKVDWRNYTDPIPYRPTSLPEDISAKCLELIKKLNLRFGAIDMILTPDDRYIFLEINPSGQWLWIEEKTEMPISDAIVKLLATRPFLGY